MKTAVVFYSLEGNTKWAAQQLAEGLSADLLELKPAKPYPTGGFAKYFFGGKAASFKEAPALLPYDFAPADYDLVVLCSPLWAWQIAPPLRSFLQTHDLSGKRVAALISCGGGDPAKAYAAITEAAHQSALCETLTLTDPLKHPAEAKQAIAGFCAKLQ